MIDYIRRKIEKLKGLLSHDSDDRTVAVNMLLSGICKPASILISYMYIPVVLNYLGIEKYGVWSTILSILSWISYLDIGIGNGLRNRLTQSIAEKDIKKGKSLISSSYAIIAILMIIATILFTGVASFVPWETVFGVADFDESLHSIVVMSFLFVASNFVLSLCKNVLYALQHASVVSFMELGVQTLNLIGVLVVSRVVKQNLMLMACVYGCSMITVNIVATVFVYSKNSSLIPSIRSVNMRSGMDLTNLGMQFFIIQICALVLFTTDNLIISSLYGAANVTPYTTVNKLFNVISHAFTALLAPIWSSVTKAKAERNFVWLNSLISKLHVLMVPFFAGCVLLGLAFRPITAWWLGQNLDFGNGLIILGMCYCVLTIWCNTYSYIANGLELMRASMTIAIIQAVLNIPMSLFFAQGLGLGSAGVLAGTVAAMGISAVATPIYVRRYVNRNILIGGKRDA